MFGIAVLCGIVGWWVYATAQQDPFVVPVQRYGDYGEWEPDRELTFRFEDWRGQDRVTGRYAVFSFPIGHTQRLSSGTPDEGSTGGTDLQHRMAFGADGTVEILPQATEEADWNYGSIAPPFYETSISPFSYTGGLIRQSMVEAKQRDKPFPGYELNQFSQADASELHYIGEHCGFDMFESVAYREWHDRPRPFDLDRAPPPDVAPPFDRARVFGWPSADGVTYDFGVICEDRSACVVGVRQRPWLNVSFQFRRPWLCDIPKVVPAHLDWLESRIVEEETEILNPDYR